MFRAYDMIARHKCRKPCRHTVLAVLMPLLLAGCDSAIYDNEGDCTVSYRVAFVYDMNMKWADAFASEVTDVTLYVTDSLGRLVATIGEEGEALSAKGFSLPLNLPAGKYHLLAWAGRRVDGGAEFGIGSDYGATLKRSRAANGAAFVSSDLNALYHGEADVTLPDASNTGGTFVYTVPLTKITNNVHVVLQQIGGERLDPSQFAISIAADNGTLDCHKGLVDDEVISYRAWDVVPGEAEIVTNGNNRTTASYPAVVAELTTSRLVFGRDVRLNVDNAATGEPIMSVPLIRYALMVKGKYNRELDDQEYLDRQDRYDLVFFLDEGHRWINSYIYVNSWKVILQETDI